MRRIALLMALGVSLVACGDDDDDPAAEAGNEVCEARDDLRGDVTEFADDIRAGNFGDAADEFGDVTESIGELTTAVGNLGDAERAAVQPYVDDITTALGDVSVSDLSNLGATIDTVRDDVNAALDAIGDTDALNCS